jgi:predicted dehydrogenase
MTAAMRRQIGIGLIRAGWMGSVHAPAYRRVGERHPELGARPRLVIAADPLGKRARSLAKRYGVEQWTTEPGDVIDHPEVEAASIAAAKNMHLPLALAPAGEGRHFSGEKPRGRFPEEARQIATAALEAGIRTLIGYSYRRAPVVVPAHDLITAGQIGDVRTYRGVFLVDYASHPQRALSWRFSRGVAGSKTKTMSWPRRRSRVVLARPSRSAA